MFAQNNIERRGPLYPVPLLHLILNVFFFNRARSFSLFFPTAIRGTIFARRAACEKARSCSRSLPMFFHLTRLVKHATRPIPGVPGFRFGGRAWIFIFHFNLHFSRSTHVHEKGRTLVRNSYSKYTTGRREFTSAGRPVDGSRAAKLFNSNY